MENGKYNWNFYLSDLCSNNYLDVCSENTRFESKPIYWLSFLLSILCGLMQA
jgi:hypothetical protein